MRVDFTPPEIHATTEMALVAGPLMRAWYDSVSVYVTAELRDRGPAHLLRSFDTQRSPNYRAVVTGIPMLARDRRPTGVTAFGIVLLRPGTLRGEWWYLESTAGYTRTPRTTARQVVDLVLSNLRR